MYIEMALGRRHRDEELDSEFEFAPEKRKKSWQDDPLAFQKPGHASHHSAALPSKELFSREQDREEWRARRFHLLSMDAYSRHKALVNQYLLSGGYGIEHIQRPTENDRNDYSVLREEHKFLWDEGDDIGSWEKQLAKAYYDRLFKEYAICDLSRYKENKVALRWRIEKEVVEGKGQFACGNKLCSEQDALQSWEVNFAYVEQGEKKNALVKLRLCPDCSMKLNYHHKRKLWKKSGHSKPAHKKHKHKHKSDHTHKHKKRKHKQKEKRHREQKEKEKSTSSEAVDSESSNSGSEDSDTKEREQDSAQQAAVASAIWSKPAEVYLEKSKVEEFEDYFKDMLL